MTDRTVDPTPVPESFAVECNEAAIVLEQLAAGETLVASHRPSERQSIAHTAAALAGAEIQTLLAEAQALCDAATPGPWAWGTDEHDYRLRSERTGAIIATVENAADVMMLARARTLVPELAALLRQQAERVAELEEQLETERKVVANWHGVVKEICDEWSEANGATCDPACDSYGHEPECKATRIAAFLRDLRAQLAEARKDGERGAAMQSTAHALNAEHSAMRARVVQLHSALENWGRHFTWCAIWHEVPNQPPPVCDCGLSRELDTAAKHIALADAARGRDEG